MVSVIRHLSRKGLVHEPLWLYVSGKSGYGNNLKVSHIQQFGYKKDSKSSNVRPSGDAKFERCGEDKKPQQAKKGSKLDNCLKDQKPQKAKEGSKLDNCLKDKKPQKPQKSKQDDKCILTKLPSEDIKLNVAVAVKLKMNVRLDEYDIGTDLFEPKDDKKKKVAEKRK